MGAPFGNRNAAGFHRGKSKKRKGYITRESTERKFNRDKKRLEASWAKYGYGKFGKPKKW